MRPLYRPVLLLLLLITTTANAAEQVSPPAPTASATPTLVFMTDFGQRDDSLAICN